MDLPLVGAHCSLDSCRNLDLLPIRCHCDSLFCRHHIAPDAHACPVDLAARNAPVGQPSGSRLQCALKQCKKLSLESYVASRVDTQGRSPAACSACQKSFCADHRHPSSHSCAGQEGPSKPKNEAARALLAKHFKPSGIAHPSSQERPTIVPTDPVKLAQYRKIELLKLKHLAIPADPKDKSSSLPLNERLHVRVQAEGANSLFTEKALWFRKSIVTGKALDFACAQLSLSRAQESVYMHRVDTDQGGKLLRLQNDQLLANQVEEGSSLILKFSVDK